MLGAAMAGLILVLATSPLAAQGKPPAPPADNDRNKPAIPLCDACKKLAVVDQVGACTDCDEPTASTVFKLCNTCAMKKGACKSCLKELKPKNVPAKPPVKPGKQQKKDAKVESAIAAGLKWLAAHQSPEGNWDSDSFAKQCKDTICEGPGFGEYDAGVTGLAVLAFLGAGVTHNSGDASPYTETVKKGLEWLIRNQDKDGCVGTRACGKFMYNHSICTWALVEAYGLTNDESLAAPANKAVDFLLAAQNPYKAWRYQVRPGDNDSSVTAWAVYALASATNAGLDVDQEGFEGALAWLDEVTDDAYYKVGYTAKGSGKVVVPNKNDTWAHHEALTAAGMACRMLIKNDKATEQVKGGAELLMQDLPAWDNNKADDKKVDFYYWFHGTHALNLYDSPDGKFSKGWVEALKGALIPNQKTDKDGCAEGSWDTNDTDRWGFEGGRVYGTALNTITLEIVSGRAEVTAQPPRELTPEEKNKAHELVKKLGDDDFETRENAAKELIGMGRPVADIVRKAKGSKDPEVRMRVEQILRKLGYRE
jgi:hypothetical protein